MSAHTETVFGIIQNIREFYNYSHYPLYIYIYYKNRFSKKNLEKSLKMSFRYLFAYLLELLKKSRTSKVISPLSLNGFNTTADNWTPPLVVLKDPVSYLTQKITNNLI